MGCKARSTVKELFGALLGALRVSSILQDPAKLPVEIGLVEEARL